MKTRFVDVAVIGCGTAGMSAFRSARKFTDKVVTIESGPYGTTCARVGCMPSKLLIAAAEAAHHIKDSSGFGVFTDSIHIDGRKVMDRVRSERDRFVGFVVESVEEFPEASRIQGCARFLAPGILQVDEDLRLEARAIVLATGSSPAIPKPFEELGDRLIINDHVFEWETLPKSVAVFGPGIIGLEIGQALHRLGVRVTLFGRGGRVGVFTDPEIVPYCRKTFGAELDFTYTPKVHGMKREGEGVKIHFEDDEEKERIEEFEYVLCATGRSPNLHSLSLENSGVVLDEKGIPVFHPRTLQCGNSPVFIAGDVNHTLPLLHEAADEGKIAGENAGRFPQVLEGNRRSELTVAFTDPQMVVVGSSFQQLQEIDRPFLTGKVSFENQGRSRVMRVNRGLMHVYADKQTHRFLGAEIFGPRAEHLGHLLAWAHQQRLTIEQMLDMVFYHPVIEEGLRTALRDVLSSS
ncbi:dihydrolipoyl dehydrogenase [bacterium]|nr:dihydrolipoyl dehydrogenase [bacterium]